MLRSVGYGPKLLRDFNELNLLRYIKEYGPLSRAELAKAYKISKATVSEIVAMLLESSFVKEIGRGETGKLGGRRPILLEFNRRAGYSIGVEIKRNHARVALTDLDANIIDKSMIRFKSGTALENVLDQVIEQIENLKETNWAADAIPMGIGVSIPGLIDYTKGCISESDTLKNWEDVPIKQRLMDALQIDTFIENDVKAMTLGEFHFGHGRNYKNLVYLWTGDGLGAGIVINGQLYRGVSASSGEVGFYELGYYIRSAEEFALLFNGQTNFAQILSEQGLVAAAVRGVKSNIDTCLSEREVTLDSILSAAEQNDAFSLELISQYAGLIGILSINLINTLNPEILIIGSEHVSKTPLLIKLIREKVKKDQLHIPIKSVDIEAASLNEYAGILGSAALVLDDIFYNSQLNLRRYRRLFKA